MKAKNSLLFVSPELIYQWNDQNYQIDKNGELIRCVILGEFHGERKHVLKQVELIELIKPEVVLHEFEAGWIYDPQAGGYIEQPNRYIDYDLVNCGGERFPALLTQQADRLGHKIVGIDFTMKELEVAYWHLAKKRPKEFEWKPLDEVPLGGYLVKRGDPDYKFTTLDPVTMELRDAQMVKEIGRYEKGLKTTIIVIVGAAHARNFHEHRLLRKYRFEYILIDQSKRKKSKIAHR